MKTHFFTIVTMFMLIGSVSKSQITGCGTPINLVQNSNFSLGNVGVNSQLSYYATCNSGSYSVGPTFYSKCNSWPTIGDHTNPANGTPNFLIVDGSTTSNSVKVWSQNVNVCAGKNYTFSFWAYSLYTNPFTLNMTIAGTGQGIVPAVATGNIISGSWNLYSRTWTAVTTGVVNVAIVQNTLGDFRDFGIDDVFFGYCGTPVTVSGNTAICPGLSTTLTANGASAYTWNTGATTPSITVSPLTTTTYTVTGDGCAFTVVTVTVNPSVNLVQNSNFSLGNVGVNSQLSYGANCLPGYYWVGPTFYSKCDSWSTIGDHTNPANGSPNFLIIDGSDASNSVKVWSQNVRVCAGKNYTFSFWAYSLYTNPFTLNMTITGTGQGTVAPFTTGNITSGSWRLYSTNWTAVASGVVSIAIVQNTADPYRDFGIDDVFFGYCAAGVAPVTVSGNTTICAGSSTTLTAGGASTYTWSTGATTPSITVSPLSTTTYTVRGSDACGFTSSAIVTVTANNLVADAGPSSIANVCQNSNIIIGTGPAISGATYAWTNSINYTANMSSTTVAQPILAFDLGITNLTAPVPSTVRYTLTVSKNGCVRTDFIDVTYIRAGSASYPTPVSAGPDFAFCNDGNPVILSGASCGSGTSVAWYPVPFANSTSCQPTINAIGTYVLYVTRNDSYSCVTSDAVNITHNGDFCRTAGLTDFTMDSQIRIYPNPSDGSMQLEYSLKAGEKGEFVIMDMLGKTLAVYTLSSEQNTLNINQGNLKNGIYIGQVRMNDTIVKTEKIVVQH